MGIILNFPKLARVTGDWETKEVWLNGRILKISKSHQVKRHSFSFNWSYEGSGCAQLALAILLEFYPREEASMLYQEFERDHVSFWPEGNLDMEINISQWKEAHDLRQVQ